MTITQEFVLPAGAVVLPVRDLSPQLRRELEASEEDFAISRPNSRTNSQIVDAEAAALIRQFEKPSTIGQAVARHSRGRPNRAQQLLEDAFPLLQSLISGGLLVGADSDEARRILPSLKPDDSFDGWTIIRTIQALEDTELYQARDRGGKVAALKIARAGCSTATRNMLDREARILSQAGNEVTPELLAAAEFEKRPYLAIEWCSGVDAASACEEQRRQGASAQGGLLRLTGRILDAYACLHQRGLVHGDVHPRNIIIDRAGAVKILDFGLGRITGEDTAAPRGGVPFFFEPEFALSVSAGTWPPPVSEAGEQYAVAALVYLLLTGSYYLDFSLEKQEMFRQIAAEPMVSFSKRSIATPMGFEPLLEKALGKDPAGRFPSISVFCAAWKAVAIAPGAPPPTRAIDPNLKRLRSEMLRRIGLGGPLLGGETMPAPKTSVNYGSAGIAYALYRMACAEDNAELLALADVWSLRAVREIEDVDAFYNKEIDITPKTVGNSSIYHSPAGVFAVQSLIAQARGDIQTQQRASGAFLETCATKSDHFDITLGRAGNVLACGFLLEAAPDDRELRAAGRKMMAELWTKIDGYASVQESQELSNLGIAHGWAGLLYATLCWCASSKETWPAGLPDRLDQLASCAEPVGRGYRWKWDRASGPNEAGGGSMPGWCNGSAGYVFLWSEAHQAMSRDTYLDLAEGAAWNAWESRGPVGNLCCGLAGQAYAQLRMYRHTGDQAWLDRAHDLASMAAQGDAHKSANEQLAMRPESLYKGDLGLVVLASDLARPECACMPLFERE